MPSILKEKTDKSPGVITFTHNELFGGFLKKSPRARQFVASKALRGEWLFGIHLNGDCSWLKEWPWEPWQSFILWPEPKAQFLANLASSIVVPQGCINFMPPVAEVAAGPRDIDICIISRPSPLKGLYESLLILRALLDRRPNLTAVIVASDQRHLWLGERAYKKQGIDRRYFEFARANFSARELSQLSFISSSEDAFGEFPVSSAVLNTLLSRSHFLLLTSLHEGGPRVLAESLQSGTPCIVLKAFRGGMRKYMDESNTLFIESDARMASAQIVDALSNYHRFTVDKGRVWSELCSESQLRIFQTQLESRIAQSEKPIEGRWFLKNLHTRLPCHGQKFNYQIMHRDEVFFRWMERCSGAGYDPYDEDAMVGDLMPGDRPRLMDHLALSRVQSLGLRVIRKIQRGH